MNTPIALVREVDPSDIVAFACGKCHYVVSSTKDNSVETARQIAAGHCGPDLCTVCNERPPEYRYADICSECRHKRWDESHERKQQAAYDKATKVDEGDYDGPVYCDQVGHNDGFFTDVDDLKEHCEYEECPIPARVWACTIRHPCLDVDSVIQLASDELPENVELDDVEELAQFIEAWNAKQSGQIWEPDYGRAIVVSGYVRHDGN